MLFDYYSTDIEVKEEIIYFDINFTNFFFATVNSNNIKVWDLSKKVLLHSFYPQEYYNTLEFNNNVLKIGVTGMDFLSFYC